VPSRRSLGNLLLIVPAFAIMVAISLGATWLLQRWQSLRCPANPLLVASGQGATILQIIPTAIASIGFGFLCVNWLAHLIPPLRRFFDRDAERHNQPGYQRSQRGLMRFSLILLAIMLPVSIAASLSQYCLSEQGILYQARPWTGLRSYSWSEVATIETKCTRSKGGWFGSYLLIMRDGASFDVMTWPRSFARVYPDIARALHGVAFTFNSEGVSRRCADANVEILLRRP
jgi:hypothetical protein